ncbi:extracellular solute-binding protein [Naasia sp. SYSU D00057]|uniref:extracellular solute-binding protein n=1 Tax=Naasia sp. SYSU D00057 TaxID=2817380 RepID=UPI001B30EAF9|nr:extracellular solute-binding protein [Naasia sp. SYSU D00057]
MNEFRLPTSAVSRRQVLLGGMAVLGAAALAGCAGPAQASGRSQLKFWHLLSGGDGVKMQGLIDEANAASDTYRVAPTVLAWGTPYYTKLAMASAGGKAPDVAIMHATRVAGYAPGGLVDPWDLDELAALGVDQNTFPERIWEKGFSGDQLYSVALDAHPFILMYNTDICDQAGLLGSNGQLNPIDSPDAFLDAARAVNGVTGTQALAYGYLGDGAQMWRLFYTLYSQQGATMTVTPGQKMEYEEDAAVTALEYMQALLDGTIANPQSDYPSAVAEFATGEAGMFLTGVWELPTMQQNEVPFDASPIPTLFGTPASYADSHSFVLPHQDSPDPAKRKAVYQFVADLLTSSFAWAEAGHVPAYLPVTESPDYADLEPQAHYAAAADNIVYDPPAWFTGSGSNFQADFGQAIQPALLGGEDAAGAFRSFVDRVNTLLSSPNPVNPEGGV